MRPAHDRQRLEALFEDVWIEVSHIESRFTLLRVMFHDRTTARVLEQTAPMTFRALGAALTEAVLLAVHRLLQPGAQRGRRTASVETLLSHLPPDAARLRRELQKALSTIRDECSDVSDLRHRHIAHRDYSVALEEVDTPRVKAHSITAAIDGFARILTEISERCGLNLPYEPGEIHLDVEQLITRLTSGSR